MKAIPYASGSTGEGSSSLPRAASDAGVAHRFAWCVLAANLAVILWGAVVRATSSGAGCGSHWPLCDGQALPLNGSTKQLIELSHRLTSGVVICLGVALVVVCRRAFPKGHPARTAAWSALGMIGVEALIGAFIVLAGLVAKNPSAGHGVGAGLHLVSTFLLLSALAAAVVCSGDVAALSLKAQTRAVRICAFLPLACLVVVGAIGAINALGDTLYPASSLAAGIALDGSDAAPLFVRLRIWHPVLATLTVFVVLVCPPLVEKLRPSRLTHRASRASLVLVLGQWALGLVNLSLLAPIPLQLVHLFTADLLWLALTTLALAAFSVPLTESAAVGSPNR